ncbi:MAG: thioredoxin domain-containing protein [bacterium]
MNKKSNRLIDEQSPYLLQHAYNPVDWFAWGDEAFSKARKEDKLIFLSIGYSTCHWCHVMEHESFEDEEVAGLMNRVFVSIKVDREERPDLDHIYMSVCQIMTGSGGWPLSVVLTPDKKPFFAGTYFPKESRYGRIGFIDLIHNIEKAWKEKRVELESSADSIIQYLEIDNKSTGTPIANSIFGKTFQQFKSRFDEQYGGFGTAPKFPSSHNLMFLLRYWKQYSDSESSRMVEKTLTEMRKGGMFDQVGFGFHRYSTDQRWFLPHFEKMLYDQAMLAIAYTEAFQETGNEDYKNTACEIFEYVLRDMTSPEGGFYSAEDADSEGEEGKFYVWNEKELISLLGEFDAAFIMKVFNVTKSGNYFEEASHKNTGENIFYLSKSLEEISNECGMDIKSFKTKLSGLRNILFNHREKRVHPLKDDKILTDWNGLMIAALAIAGRIFEEKKYLIAAEKAANFILNYMTNENGKLLHRFRNGCAGLDAHIDDYAFMTWGLIELYEATFNAEYLKTAMKLNDVLIQNFGDVKNGGFFFTSSDSEELIVRTKEYYDGAIPSGNSVAAMNLIRLEKFSANPEYGKLAHGLFGSNSDAANNSPSAFTHLINAFNFASGPSYEIIIAGEPDWDSTKNMIEIVNQDFIPNKVVMLADENLKNIFPHLAGYIFIEGKATAYVCKNYACELPVNEPHQLAKIFEKL